MEIYTNKEYLDLQYTSDEENVYDETNFHNLTIKLNESSTCGIQDNHDSLNSTEELEIIIRPNEMNIQQRHQEYTYKEFNKKVI